MSSLLSIFGGIAQGFAGLVQWGLGIFQAKNSPDAVKAAQASQDEATLKKANEDAASGDVKKLGEDISQ